jgi:hypothetical protein
MEYWNDGIMTQTRLILTFLPNIPIFQYSNIPVVNQYSILPIFRYSSYFSLFWNLRELKIIIKPPKITNASIWGQRISNPFPFRKTPRMMIKKYRKGFA